MRLGIVIPTYDRAGKVNRLLQSLAVGERIPDEVIVIENSPSMIDVDVVGSPLVGRVRTVQLGAGLNLSAARNAGAAALSSEVLLFIDDDNVVEKQFCARLMEVFETDRSAVAVAPVIKSLATGLIWCAGVRRKSLTGKTVFVGHGAAQWHDSWPTTSPEMPNCFAVRQEAFESVGGFDDSLFPFHFEDADFAARLRAQTGKEFIIVPAAVVFHDVPPQISTGSVVLRSLEHGGGPRVRALSQSRVLFFGLRSSSPLLATWLLSTVPTWTAIVVADTLRQPEPFERRLSGAYYLCLGTACGYARLGAVVGHNVHIALTAARRRRVRGLEGSARG